MPAKLRIYSLESLAPEVRAVCFAKCSRSPEPFDQIAKALTEEKTRRFHERWVVGYGHSSVAEHASLSIALENITILATKVIEDNRLCSFTEKSTRYQIFDKERYYLPPKIAKSSLAKSYQETCDYLFEVYQELHEPVKEYVIKKYPLAKFDKPQKMYDTYIHGKTCDIIRYLLPVATQTNMGWTVNARNLEHAINKLLSSPLEELKIIGRKVRNTALKITPTLLKHTGRNTYLAKTVKKLTQKTEKIIKGKIDQSPSVTLIDYDRDAENKLVAALLYRFSQHPYKQIYLEVKKMTVKKKAKIIDEALKYRGKFDAPLRELEHVYYTFDILMDYGAFRDIQRHRICTQTNQLVTTIHGYDIPPEIVELGLKDKFVSAMEASDKAYREISQKYPYEAQYVVALAFRKRTLFTFNLREAHHLISLRSKPQGHISYRRIVNLIYDEIAKVQPNLAKYIRVTRL